MPTTEYTFIIFLIFGGGYERVATVTLPYLANKQQEGKWGMVKNCCAILLHKQI